ncbi:MAG: S9 family peptidase [Acidobacteriota bacterium]
MRSFLLVLSLLVSFPIVAAEQALKRPTLEAIFEEEALTLEEPSGVMWMPEGDEILYRATDGDDEVLWLEDVADGARRRVVSWSEMTKALKEQRPNFRRLSLGDVNAACSSRSAPTVSPDGRYLVGSAAGDLFRLDLETGTARYLTGDDEPEIHVTFSPDGMRLAFVRSGDLYWMDGATGVIHRVTDRMGRETITNGVAAWVYEEELGLERSYWWSPDGSRLAFLQFDSSGVDVVPIADASMPIPGLEVQRYPKAGRPNPVARLGVVGVEGGDPVWIQVGDDDQYLPRAGWTPAGGVWFQRLNRDQTVLELLVAGPVSGESRVLMTDRDEAWVNVGDDLFFLADGRFLWTSERDGWNHLYLYAADGTLEKQLTNGRWQVDGVTGLDESQSTVFFRANAEELRQWHLYALDLETGETRRLGREVGGDHCALLAPGGRWLVDSWSALDTPPRADLVKTADDTVVREQWRSGAELEDWDLLPVEAGAITTEDGIELHTQLIRPRDFDPAKKYPFVLYVYGGPHSQLTANRWGGSIHHTYRVFAEMGIGVFLVDNRGTWGRGHAFETAVHRRLGQVEVTDQVAAARWLKEQPWVDGDRVAVYGGSYGGYMTLMLMLKAPEMFKAGIAYAPVTDWRLYDSVYTERYMDTPEDNPEGYDEGAPLGFADQLNGSLLIVHGSRDNNVHLQNTLQMVAALAGADKDFELMIYPKTRHGVRRGQFALHFHRLKVDFLKRTLLAGITD